MSIKSDLAKFYTQNAQHYHQTRQKHWADGEHFLNIISQSQVKKPKILELGCGGGRFLSYLKANYHGEFEYVGIDLSEGLLALAQKDHPEQTFLHGDMLSEIAKIPQENYDFIVACASFQHLENDEERLFLLRHCYRVLKYEGQLLMTNWAFSKRFLRKHRKIFLRSAFLQLVSLGKKSWRDVFIPRTNKKGETDWRYYHLFSLKELKELLLMSGFVPQMLEYLDKRGIPTTNRKVENNSFLHAKKQVFKA